MGSTSAWRGELIILDLDDFDLLFHDDDLPDAHRLYTARLELWLDGPAPPASWTPPVSLESLSALSELSM